jgi:hypothetical protein
MTVLFLSTLRLRQVLAGQETSKHEILEPDTLFPARIQS